jgi:hypothetical protein
MYFNYKKQEQQRPIDILASLIRQLVNQLPQLPQHIKTLHENCERENRQPSRDELYTALVELPKSFAQVFIVFDALDECDREKRRDILLPMFHRKGESRLRLFLTSRRYPDDIGDSLRDVQGIEIAASGEDIRSYIHQRINTNPRANRIFRESSQKEQIISELVDAA